MMKRLHRHHAPTVGHRWSIGVESDGQLVGAAICGRPVARMLPHDRLLEVNRLVTDGTPNACSKLYQACARIAKEMGFYDIETTILASELGTSLKAAGWTFRRKIKGGDWNRPSRGGRRTDQPMCDKQVWGRTLNTKEEYSALRKERRAMKKDATQYPEAQVLNECPDGDIRYIGSIGRADEGGDAPF